MNIEWSKAPEGFPLWLEGTNEEHRKHSGWYRDAGQVFEGAYGGQWRACREGQFFTVHRNPGPSNWTGEGLPPVGTVCEAMLPSMNHQWAEAVVVWHHPEHEGSAVVVHSGGRLTGWSSAFRPIRTPEQIAAEEREKAIEVMIADTNILTGIMSDRRIMAGQLYDAGYRKQVSE